MNYCDVLDCCEPQNCPVHSCAKCVACKHHVDALVAEMTKSSGRYPSGISEQKEVHESIALLRDAMEDLHTRFNDMLSCSKFETDVLKEKLSKWMTLANSGNQKDIQKQTAITVLGSLDLLIAYSKSGYRRDHPDELVIFNANVVSEEAKIWFGDLNVTESEAKLQSLANTLKQKVFVLNEMDAKWDTEATPDISRPARVFTPQ